MESDQYRRPWSRNRLKPQAMVFALALLGSLSVAREYLALRDGPRRFRPTSTCSALLRCRTGGPTLAAYGTFNRYGHAFQRVRLRESLVTPMCPVLQPHPDESGWFGLVRFRSPLLTESLLLSSPPGNEMFQFPGFAPDTYGFSARPFGHPGLNARLTAPPGFSQSSTPFLASWRQDIPHTPLVA
jgi:hypothetical protein